TDALNTKQAKGDYATKTELTQGLNTKLNSAAVKQTTGNSTSEVMSQKACDDNYAKKNSGEPLKVGRLNVESASGDTIFNLGGTNGSAGAEFAYVRNSKRTQVHDTSTKTTVLFPQKSGEIALKSDVEAIDNYPVGAPIPWPQATPPKGYLICNGKPFDKAKYPKLAQAYPSGRLPELRGEFIRGLSAGRDGVDVGRTVLSAQGDAIRNIKGTFKGSAGRFNPEYVTGVFKLESMNAVGAGHGNYNELGKVSFDPSRVVPTANENRPRNVAFLYIVRAA
ncbi:phage tail protein, partial [Arsenophonus nasoniae]|uniref:phage tail protein n=1 Tax=Arsenophonus nasoniae TaxID=638 RepID=UPI0038796D07